MNITQAKELENTILWTEFCKEVDTKIAYHISLLTACKPEELVEIQKMISALHTIKNIPRDVIEREES
jgi:hypothetical protein